MTPARESAVDEIAILRPSDRWDDFETDLESAFLASGLTVTLRTTLKQLPGSRHWHVKRGRAPGTLEVTLLPSQRRAWFGIHSNRRGEWIAAAMSDLKQALEAPPGAT